MSDYKHPEGLVSTEWVAEHLNDPKIRLVEVDVDTTAYDQGHISGAVGWNWRTHVNPSKATATLDSHAVEIVLPKASANNERCKQSLSASSGR